MNKFTNKRDDIAGKENLISFNTLLPVDRYADGFLNGFSYIFVTRPSLFIYPYKEERDNLLQNLAYENMTKDPVFIPYTGEEGMSENDIIIAEQLSFYGGMMKADSRRTNFLPLFTNRVKNMSVSDSTIDLNRVFNTRHGYSMSLPTHMVSSLASGELSMLITETANLEVLKTLNLWTRYMSNISDGTFHANPEMIKNGVIDYMSSIYYFVTEPDGRTIKYWAKYTGAFPTNVPSSNLSYAKGDHSLVEHSVSFLYTIKEEMNPAIFEDFNRVSLNRFETKVIDVEDDDYSSVRNSPLLSPAILNDTLKSPVVIHNIDSNQKKSFKLIFNEGSSINDITKEIVGEEYTFNYIDFLTDKDMKE